MTYLEKLKNNLKIDQRTSMGVTEQEIHDVENKFKIKFPLAYKEFLLMAGKSIGGLYPLATADLETVSSGWFHELMHELMQIRQIRIEKPYWIFSHEDMFAFFFLEDGVEDPIVYYTKEGKGNNSPYEIESYGKTFSGFISDCIDDSKLKEKTGIW